MLQAGGFVINRKPSDTRQKLRYISIPLAMAALVIVIKKRDLDQEDKGRGAAMDSPLALEPLSETEADDRSQAPVLSLTWSSLADEATTLVIGAPQPTYAALLLQRPDESLEVKRPLIFIGEEGEQRFSLGAAAFEGTYCTVGAASPAALKTLLDSLDGAQSSVVCAEPLEGTATASAAHQTEP